ncbi:hypothetical protein PV326_007453 [Microctonus aethiopoides]|uniref:PWWP domain-containing protein n=1 Tax=Microctonus aethiopoides TaxID=144406 RepID=A0AA39KKX1_9HYME|nr:hypothetical protein PV326_007453 [Microctonus aethiopoides]KAK0165265.1 hypothetical protein PV328_003797 [Microctonus aethiopoides]
MADIGTETVKKILRGDKIIVTVESIIPDIIVVSFVDGIKSFQGALLDVNKRNLPCGINLPEPTVDRDGDKVSTLAARFTYFQDENKSTILSSSPKFDLRKKLHAPNKLKNVNRPTVRLRPRQVLCNKCQSICNESNENIGIGKKRKQCDDKPEEQENINSLSARSINRRSVRRCVVQQQTEKNQIDGKIIGVSSLIPKISRLDSTKCHETNQNDQLERNIQLCWLRSTAATTAADESLLSKECKEYSSDISSQAITSPPSSRQLNDSSGGGTIEISKSLNNVSASKKKTLAAADSTIKNTPRTDIQRVSRKKRSIGSMEDLWDENIFEDIIKTTAVAAAAAAATTTQVTPVIKISFGARGEGTVLKIPPKIKNSSDNIYKDNENHNSSVEHMENTDELVKLNDNSSLNNKITNMDFIETQIDSQKSHGKDVACEKAAKRALKKAKKEARKKMVNGGVSPARSPLNSSPRYNSTYDPLLYHRRKHKVKHKKKHKDERKPHKIQPKNDIEDKNEEKSTSNTDKQPEIHRPNCNIFPVGESYTAIKEQCLKQKLSISLKRLNANAYTRCDYPVSNASSGCKSPGISSEELSEPEQLSENNVDTSDNISDFPTSHPLSIRFAATPVAHCLTATGKRLNVGDIVWGKIRGFPWWPGKVLSISISCKEDGSSSGPQAHVAWYGSSTCSLMSCDRLSPFLETFKARYNKKKRGPYKEAIRQAQSEAQIQISSDSSTENVANVCKSSREVNVIS